MRVMLVCLVLLAGCVSEETRQLAQGIHRYQAKQAAIVKRLADFAEEKGAIEEADRAKIMAGQEALSESTRSLSEILGEPRVPVEVDSW